jgi:hypothetical protein
MSKISNGLESIVRDNIDMKREGAVAYSSYTLLLYPTQEPSHLLPPDCDLIAVSRILFRRLGNHELSSLAPRNSKRSTCHHSNHPVKLPQRRAYNTLHTKAKNFHSTIFFRYRSFLQNVGSQVLVIHSYTWMFFAA